MSAVAEISPAPQSGASLVQRMGQRFGVDPGKLMATLKATCFNVANKEVSNEQMMALLVVADQYRLNPFTKEIFAFPDRNGIVPVVSVDGWARIINGHAQFDGMDFEYAEDGSSCACIIHRKDRGHPIRVTEYMAEVRRDTAPWKSHPRRMLRHKTLIQCARIAFGFAGIYDEDEAERIVEAQIDPENDKHTRLAQACAALKGSIAAIKEGIETGDLSKAAEAWFELTQDEQESIWIAPTRNVNGKRVVNEHAPFTTKEREVIKSSEFRKAHFGDEAEFTETETQ
jgi:phage recombination protein Bet